MNNAILKCIVKLWIKLYIRKHKITNGVFGLAFNYGTFNYRKQYTFNYIIRTDKLELEIIEY